jgi:hypothetical protein
MSQSKCFDVVVVRNSRKKEAGQNLAYKIPTIITSHKLLTKEASSK